MKTFIYLIITCFIGTGAFYDALYSRHPFPSYVVGFGIWGLFFWGCNSRYKKASERRMREQLFENYMRSKVRNPNRF